MARYKIPYCVLPQYSLPQIMFPVLWKRNNFNNLKFLIITFDFLLSWIIKIINSQISILFPWTTRKPFLEDRLKTIVPYKISFQENYFYCFEYKLIFIYEINLNIYWIYIEFDFFFKEVFFPFFLWRNSAAIYDVKWSSITKKKFITKNTFTTPNLIRSVLR